ncbi:PIKK family atypical protein kinase [Tritrichomonas foetus]|uniref:PIKK family atypical protein kinase n=1 Tax=Tritrichomonas foetus TaxID=1144522 RepID=A0A1J4JW73_9EUKA|nr:PIKK family atypical protein kinase [Tritrichomonas foetus]|eukprot:OHT01774.1 PIKK family atypical protein kinase [Tritrichomonas foetus]
MQNGGDSILQSIISKDPIKDYRTWKNRRKSLASNLGSTLLTFSESELINIFSNIESQLYKLFLQSPTPDHELLGLLYFSIMHLFHKSYDQIHNFFPSVSNLTSSSNRDVCRAACCCLRYLVEESADNITFLRESLDSAAALLSKDQGGRFIFNALSILRVVGRFLPTDVFGITCQKTVEIWAAACSNDPDLRLEAVKVYSIHLINAPINSQESFAQSSFFDCIETLNSSKVEAYDGVVLICKNLYDLFPKLYTDARTTQLRDKLLHAASISNAELLNSIYQLVIILCDDKPNIMKMKANEFLMILISQLMRGVGIPSLLSKIVALLQVYKRQNFQNVMVQGVIDLVSYLSPMKQYQKHTDDIFCVLLNVLKLYKGEVTAPPSLFLKATPCNSYLQAIRLCPTYLKDLRGFLMDHFAKGIHPKSSSEEQIVSIIMVRLFDKLLFDVGPNLYDSLLPFCYSNNRIVRQQMALTLSNFRTVEANNELMRMAVMDDNEKVRLTALNNINPKLLVNNLESITQLLVDPSFEVRRMAIPVIAISAPSSVLIPPMIIVFMNDFFASNVAHSSPSRSADTCSLLPCIAKHFLQFSQPFVPIITWICLKFLLHDEPIPVIEKGVKIGQWVQNDISQCPHHDIIADHFAPHNTINERDVNKMRIYQVENEKYLESRDTYLFETLGQISKELMPYLLQIVPVFIKTFSEKHTESVYKTAARALIRIVRASESTFNFIVVFPKLLPTLLNLLADENSSQELAIAILKLTGTIGASKSKTENAQNEDAVEHLFAIKSPSFFTSFVMKALVEMIKKEPMPSIFKAITIIYMNETKFALTFLQPVITAFVQSIEHEPENTGLWNQLEIICCHCEEHVFPYLDLMKPIFVNHIKKINCIHLCTIISYHLKVQFTEIATILYPLALHFLDTTDKNYFKALTKFISFTILFQHQCAELFIESSEKIIATAKEEKISILMKRLSFLLQLTPMAPYSARITRIALKVYSNNDDQQQNENVNQALYNLCIFGYLTPEKLIEDDHYDELNDAIINGVLNIDLLPFIKKYKAKPSSKHLKAITQKMKPTSSLTQHRNIFTDPIKAQFNNTRQWIEDLCVHVVENSPSIAIRSCSQVIGQSQAFRSELFPIAFLSCWKAANDMEMQVFSKSVRTIFGFEKLDPQVISLIELIDRAGLPLDIPDCEIAKKCSSTSMALYFYQRHLKKHPDDINTLQNLLALNSRMGRITSASGLLYKMSEKLDTKDMGKWSEQLGQWEQALEIYEPQRPQNMTSLLECYARLELWEKVRESAPEFVHMDAQDKQKSALWYAWAFYHVKKFKNVEYYLKFLPDKNDINVVHFKSMYLIAADRYDEAKISINKGFKLLTENLSVFNGSDAKEASRRMVYAQHLIELLEVLELKQSNIVDTPQIWQNRLKYFSHESESWMKLIEIRSLVLSPADHSESYLKMLSVLRKERRWKLIDVYCNRFFLKTTSTPVILARLKIMWTRGLKKQAMNLLTGLNKALSSETDEEALGLFGSFPQEERKLIYEFFNISRDGNTKEIGRDIVSKFRISDNKMLARLLRIQANWQYHLYTAQTSSAELLLDICKVYERSKALVGDDYRTFSGWAYASSRALSHFPEKSKDMVPKAIDGFLKATQFRPSESLEFLCQLFSIFFRYDADFEDHEKLCSDILKLPPNILHQIIPQIVVHISHNNEKVSKVVQKIISEFGSDHFQAVVFSLNVLSLLSDRDKAKTAKDLMEKLGQKHPKVYEDSLLLIDGMHRSAVSWTEMWLTALDTASRAQQMNDRDLVIKLIQKVYDMIEKPICESDMIFKRSHGASLQRCRMNFERYKAGPDPSVQRAMWDGFRVLYAEMDDKIKKMDNVQLSKVSERLAAHRNFELAIPGTYSVDGHAPKLDYIDPILKVLNSQQHPRAVFMVDTSGIKYKFLLKGNEDLRLDQRIMQFFNLINSLLKTNRNTADLGVSILDYAIVPFAPNSGLITWVTGADTFQQLVTDYRVYRDIRQNIELEIAQQLVGPIFNQLSALQRYEIFTNVAEQTEANELREMLWLRSPDPTSWLQRNRIFTISTSLMSMAGYTIGLGDRHPSNIMVQRHTGRCLHIDFGDSFEVAMKRPVFAERVPFRMTRMMINSLDCGNVEGLFRKVCQDVLWVLRENQSSIIALMEVFIHEPIFYGKEINPSDEGQKNILKRVKAKLDGNDPAPYGIPTINYETEQQVDTLIKKASDPREYIRHYVGWCPFW